MNCDWHHPCLPRVPKIRCAPYNYESYIYKRNQKKEKKRLVSTARENQQRITHMCSKKKYKRDLYQLLKETYINCDWPHLCLPRVPKLRYEPYIQIWIIFKRDHSKRITLIVRENQQRITHVYKNNVQKRPISIATCITHFCRGRQRWGVRQISQERVTHTTKRPIKETYKRDL